MREEGGCGHWTASPIRVEAAEYLVCVRNRREQWAAMDFEHGVAFLVARIARTKPSPHAARIMIEFSSYAMVDVLDAWKLLANGQRFPVAYIETTELFRRLGLDPGKREWQQLAPHAPEMSTAAEAKSASFTGAIADAKRKLAASLGIASDKIEITIRL